MALRQAFNGPSVRESPANSATLSRQSSKLDPAIRPLQFNNFNSLYPGSRVELGSWLIKELCCLLITASSPISKMLCRQIGEPNPAIPAFSSGPIRPHIAGNLMLSMRPIRPVSSLNLTNLILPFHEKCSANLPKKRTESFGYEGDCQCELSIEKKYICSSVLTSFALGFLVHIIP